MALTDTAELKSLVQTTLASSVAPEAYVRGRKPRQITKERHSQGPTRI